MSSVLSPRRPAVSEAARPVEPQGRDGATLAEAAYRTLRADIIAGRQGPGERLRIERLRTRYGIGPTPLREALHRLSAERLVEAEVNRGFRVAPLDPEGFADLNVARVVVETAALRLAIDLGGDEWEADVVSAAHLMGKADAAFGGDLDGWEAVNRRFHRALVAACGSRTLLQVRDDLQDKAERHRRASVGDGRSRRDLGAEHRAIAEAVLSRDAEAAVTLTRRHFEATAEGLRRAPPS